MDFGLRQNQSFNLFSFFMFGERGFLPEDVSDNDRTTPFPKLKLVPALSPERKELPPLRTGSVTPKETQVNISSLEFQVGQTFQDQHGDAYTVKKQLGEGGMGSVFVIEQERIIGQERVGIERALKIIRADLINEVPAKEREKRIKRFHREMDIVSKLHNPFILPVTDVIEIEVGGKKTVGLVTELVEGTDLDHVLKKEKKPMDPKRVVEMIGELTIALETLKDAGLVHRDLKPANIFLQDMPNGKPLVRLGDFGITLFESEMDAEDREQNGVWGSLHEKYDERITDPGSVMGSPAQMAPEQVRGERVTHQSDLYALGAVMYQMLTGKPPFESFSAHKIMVKHLDEIPKPFIAIGVEHVPVWLEDIVQKLLFKQPSERFDSAASVFAALKAGVKKDYPEMLNEIPFNWNIA